jgi:hypothetical protein
MHQLADARQHAKLCQLAELLFLDLRAAKPFGGAGRRLSIIHSYSPGCLLERISNNRAFIRRSQHAEDCDRRQRCGLRQRILFNSLRLAIALREQSRPRFTPLFNVGCGHRRAEGQKPAEGYNIQQMLEILTAQNVPVKLCKTCTDGRGITTCR